METFGKSMDGHVYKNENIDEIGFRTGYYVNYRKCRQEARKVCQERKEKLPPGRPPLEEYKCSFCWEDFGSQGALIHHYERTHWLVKAH